MKVYKFSLDLIKRLKQKKKKKKNIYCLYEQNNPYICLGFFKGLGLKMEVFILIDLHTFF